MVALTIQIFSIPPKCVDILFWLKQHQNISPLLSIAAQSVLAFPASSAKSERVYSSGANIVTAKRTRMKPNKVEQTIVIRENKSMVDDFKKNTTYNIVETGENDFLHIDIIEILNEATDDLDIEAELIDTDDEKSSNDGNYDTDLSEDNDEMDEYSDD